MPKPEKFWNLFARRYARSPVSDEAAYQTKLAKTQEYFSPEMTVLEFGCGTGSTAIVHAPHVARLDAIDFSENMIAIARDKAAAAGRANAGRACAPAHRSARHCAALRNGPSGCAQVRPHRAIPPCAAP